MQYKRIFTFGCSFTQFFWPTWADVLAVASGIPTFNGGLAGIGNVGIFHQMLAYDLKYKFNSDDLILVMWTSFTREDRFINNNWRTSGNILNKNIYYTDEFIRQHWAWENDVVKNSSAIISANRMFNIAQNFKCFEHLFIEPDSILPDEPNRLPLDTPKAEQIFASRFPQMFTFNLDGNHFSGRVKDQHPDILNHIKFYDRYIANKFGFGKLNSGSCLHEWHDDIVRNVPVDACHQKQLEYISNYFEPHRKHLAQHDHIWRHFGFR